MQATLAVHDRPEEFAYIADTLGVPAPVPIDKKTRNDGALSLPDAVIEVGDD